MSCTAVQSKYNIKSQLSILKRRNRKLVNISNFVLLPLLSNSADRKCKIAYTFQTDENNLETKKLNTSKKKAVKVVIFLIKVSMSEVLKWF